MAAAPRFFLACVICCICQSALSQNSSDQEQQLKQLKQNIETLQAELEKTRSTRDELNEALEKTEKNIGELSKQAQEIREKLEQKRNNLEQLREERSELQELKQQQDVLVGNYINAAYRLGQQSYLRMLLNQEDPALVSRNIKYFGYFAEARAAKINNYVATINRIDEIEPEIAYETRQIENQLSALESKMQQLSLAQAERRTIVNQLSERIMGQDQRLIALQQDRDQLERVITRMLENIADIQPKSNTARFASLKGKLPWPTQGTITRSFGSQRVANKMNWEGVLIGANSGDPVSAVHYGRVVFSDYLRGHGLLIIIDHGAGFLSLYAHNQALFKELGEWVESGEVIATVGNSGGQQQAALYFELRHNGEPTDPTNWLRRA